ncbi:sensor histidine kinase [Pseudomonas sp. LRF_L74]|uniref:sensor histidine kinase n=1 Tax=Pseudomonas sp. LRF_L74 TaxID=3369422 RepID=UPI003F5EF97D
MEFKQSLSRRIVIAFVLMTVLVGGTFAVGIVETTHLVEERLISTGLGGDLGRLLRMGTREDWRHHPVPGQLFYFSGGPGDFAYPSDLEHLPRGFHEVFRGEHSYHAFVEIVDGRRYALLQDQTEFEDREQLLFAVVLTGFLISVALSGLLGWLLARKVIEPVGRLARQVRHRDQLLIEQAPAMAPDYAQDEVGELAAAFDSTLSELRLALMRERLFTSDVSHELRTPLMVLASSCELLQVIPNLDERARGQVERIHRATEEMRALVQIFLLLARARQNEPGMAPLGDVASIANDVVEHWRQAIVAKGLQFNYQPELAGGRRHNAPLLSSVMNNLLRNALHYTESGHITLRLLEDAFVVEDSGVGIPEAEREAVFQPFVRGGAARGEGLGLGLSLVDRICKSQGWLVTLDDAQPRGCRFEVRMELREEQAADAILSE